MAEKRICSGCGVEYWWPGARWQHDQCVVANSHLVANKHGKYADSDKRKKYMREYMARRRAKK